MRTRSAVCPHPLCGAQMTELYRCEKTEAPNGAFQYHFVPVGWMCPICGIMKASTEGFLGPIRDHSEN